MKHCLVKPIDVHVDKDESGIVVYDDNDLTYGLGDTVDEAVTDYCTSLVAELEILRKDRTELAGGLVERLRLLEEHIQTDEEKLGETD